MTDDPTIPVRETHRFETGPLAALLEAELGARLLEVRQFAGGQSNPTFLLKTSAGDLILRKQPPGDLLPSAHAVDREFRVIKALGQTDVPVPKAVLYSDDRAIVGTPFFLMERLEGRLFWDPTLPEVPKTERRAIYFGMIDALARLHKADPVRIGLADFGRPGSYFARQTARWTKQWEQSQTRPNPAIDRLAAWLPQNMPTDDGTTTICHGDFRLDNMIFHATEPRVIGILDWELSTLGHPLADLAYHQIPYVTSPEIYRGLMGLDLAGLGLPSRLAYERAYLDATGREEGVTPFHLAFSLFRLAVILEGVLARGKAGNASSSNAEEMGARGLALAERGWEIASGGEW